LSGPIVRTGTTPKFWQNYDRIFSGAGSKKSTTSKKEIVAPSKKETAAKAEAKSVSKAEAKPAKTKSAKKAAGKKKQK